MPTNVQRANELRELDAIAVRASVGLLDDVRESDLELASPCAGWNLRDLLAHMTVQHYGFAAAASGDGDPKHWEPGSPATDPVGSYRAAAEHVLRAFAGDAVPEMDFPLPEAPGGRPIPAAFALSMHLVDYVVHSWDVAKTLGLPLHFDDRVLAAALEVARQVPNGEERLAPGAAFAPSVAYTGDSRLDEIMALLGRTPGLSWTPLGGERMADSMFGPDGTADPPPPPLFPDPLAGLVTGDLLAHPVEGVDVPQLRVARPVTPEPGLAATMSDPSAAELAKVPPPRVRTGRPPGYVPAAGPTRREIRKVAGAMGGRQSIRSRERAAPYAGQAASPKRAGKTGAIVLFVLIALVIVYNLFSDLANAISGWFH